MFLFVSKTSLSYLESNVGSDLVGLIKLIKSGGSDTW